MDFRQTAPEIHVSLVSPQVGMIAIVRLLSSQYDTGARDPIEKQVAVGRYRLVRRAADRLLCAGTESADPPMEQRSRHGPRVLRPADRRLHHLAAPRGIGRHSPAAQLVGTGGGGPRRAGELARGA